MDTIILFDPSIKTYNKGDEIIMNSAEEGIKEILENRFIVRCSTHAPVSTAIQNTRFNPRMRIYNESKYKFICGSNLLWRNMCKMEPSLNVNLLNCRPYKSSILFGVGVGQNNSKTNLYTKLIYNKILSKKYKHSVRDENAKKFLESMGYEAINTGCPTMWKLNKNFCKDIPTKKADKVVFTLTDYNRDINKDKILIDILKNNYKEVYFWIQGIFDAEYFKCFNNTEGIRIIPPTLLAYKEILSEKNIDYVGTRLHGGIFAMQHKIRSVIISIDNRAKDISNCYQIQSIEREDISNLDKYINSEFHTDISLQEDNIKEWLAQF